MIFKALKDVANNVPCNPKCQYHHNIFNLINNANVVESKQINESFFPGATILRICLGTSDRSLLLYLPHLLYPLMKR